MSSKLAWPVAAGAIAMAAGAWLSSALRPQAAAPTSAAAPQVTERNDVLVEIRDELRRIRERLDVQPAASAPSEREELPSASPLPALDLESLLDELRKLTDELADSSRALQRDRRANPWVGLRDAGYRGTVFPHLRKALWAYTADEAGTAAFCSDHRFKGFADILGAYGGPDYVMVDGSVIEFAYEDETAGRMAELSFYEGLVIGGNVD